MKPCIATTSKTGTWNLRRGRPWISYLYHQLFASYCASIYVACFESDASYLFSWKIQQVQRAQWHCLIEQILSYKILFFNIVTTISYKFLRAMNKSLHAVLVKSCTAVQNMACLSQHHHCWNAPPTTSLCSHPLFGLYKRSASLNECQRVQFFPHGEFQRHSFASYTLPCPISLCQTVYPPLSVTWQQNIMEYWWEDLTSTAIPPTSASDVVD